MHALTAAMADSARLLFPVSLESAESADFDSVVIVGTGLDADHLEGGLLEKYREPLKAHKEVDPKAEEEVFVLGLSDKFPVRRLVFSPTGPLNRDYDDVRAFVDAACKGVKRATAAGSSRPLVVLPNKHTPFTSYHVATVLGALHGLYVPLEIREDVPSRKQKVTRLGFANFPIPLPSHDKSFDRALAIERGRIVCRDIGGSDPERMAPPRVVEYVSTCSRIRQSRCASSRIGNRSSRSTRCWQPSTGLREASHDTSAG